MAGIKVIAEFILTKGIKKSIEKFGKESVDKARQSKTFKKMLDNPPMTIKDKAIFYGALGMGALGLTGAAAGLKSISMAKDFNKLQKERKDAESKSKKNIKVKLLEEKQKKSIKKPDKTKNPRIKNNNKLDSYIR